MPQRQTDPYSGLHLRVDVSNSTTKTELDFMYLFFMHFLSYPLSDGENDGINPTTYME